MPQQKGPAYAGPLLYQSSIEAYIELDFTSHM
jgi:hypothetical protein